MTQEQDNEKVPEQVQESTGESNSFERFFRARVIGGIAVAIVALWGFWMVIGLFDHSDKPHEVGLEQDKAAHPVKDDKKATHKVEHDTHKPAPVAEHAKTGPHSAAVPLSHQVAPMVPGIIKHHKSKAKGVAFIEAIISSLDYELNERFYGWRRNDILRFTDNVENIQLGVLEVVRRASVTATEKISRHGPADVIDENLENAMNWFMIKPNKYWLPSPETKYNDGLHELKAYAEKLEKGKARFYTRPDNLIPLLVSFTELLGSCDENLVKTSEEDGTPVSWFKVDDYFYYAKGVAKAMGKILHAVEEDFSETLKARHGTDLLEHAVHACHVASELDPWLVTDAYLDGILANHRANMAAPISHARYYLGVLVKTLST